MSEATPLISTDKIDEIIAQYEPPEPTCCFHFVDTLLCPLFALWKLVKGIMALVTILFLGIVYSLIVLWVFIRFALSCSCCSNGPTATFYLYLRKWFGDSRVGLEQTRGYNICYKMITLYWIRDDFIYMWQILERFFYVATVESPRPVHFSLYELYGGEGNAYPFLKGMVVRDREKIKRMMSSESSGRGDQFLTYPRNPAMHAWPWSVTLESDDPIYRCGRDLIHFILQNPYTDVPDNVFLDPVTPDADPKELPGAFCRAISYQWMGVMITTEDALKIQYFFLFHVLVNTSPILHTAFGGGIISTAIEGYAWYLQKCFDQRSPRLVDIARIAAEHNVPVTLMMRYMAVTIVVNIQNGFFLPLMDKKFKEDPDGYRALFQQNPRAWCIDGLRRGATIVTTSCYETSEPVELMVEGRPITFPKGLKWINGIWDPNHDADDKRGFGRIDVGETDMDQCVVFNGSEEGFANRQIPYRGCPGRHIGLDWMIKILGKRFAAL